MIDEREIREMLGRRADSISATPTDPVRAVRRARRRVSITIGTAIVAAAAAVLVVAAGVTSLLRASPVPADHPRPTSTASVQRRDGEVLQYPGSLVAVDPATGGTRVVVPASGAPSGSRIDIAAWSPDGRWLAFDVRGCTAERPNAGLWVSDAVGAERRVMDRPCEPGAYPVNEEWAWSPATAQLAVERSSADGDSLVLIDAATGNVVDLGPAIGDVTTLTWSPDGTQIAYGSFRGGGAVYVVDVGSGSSRVLADGIGFTYGIGGSPIRWSSDGAHITIVARERLYLVNADGSNLRVIAEPVENADWSPDGSRIAFATYTGPKHDRQLQIWTLSPQNPTPFLVFEGAQFTVYRVADPVWSPDGARIGFATKPAAGEFLHVAIDADGAGEAAEIGELLYDSWRGGWFFCECYG